MINVLGLVTVLHQSVSHMTGNVSVLAMSLVHWQPESILYLLLVTVCYVIGSFYSGVILGNSHFRFGRRYGLPLTLVAFFILCWFFLPYFPRYALLGPALQWGCGRLASDDKALSSAHQHLSGAPYPPPA